MPRITIQNMVSTAFISNMKRWFDEKYEEKGRKELIDYRHTCSTIFDFASIYMQEKSFWVSEYSFTISLVLGLLVLPKSRNRKVSWRNQDKAMRVFLLSLPCSFLLSPPPIRHLLRKCLGVTPKTENAQCSLTVTEFFAFDLKMSKASTWS